MVIVRIIGRGGGEEVGMTVLDITTEERRADTLAADRLAECVRAVREDGYIIPPRSD